MNSLSREYITSKGWKFTTEGNQFVLAECPLCGKAKKFYISIEKGLWDCKVCGEKGNLYQLKEKMGDLLAKTKVSKRKSKPMPKEYPCKMDEWHDALLQNEKRMGYLTVWRGFKVTTIQKFKLLYRDNMLGFPYFYGGKMIMIKWRPDNKVFSREPAGIESVFFNIDTINHNQPLIICEGEFDVIAATQMGFTNIVSVPNGADSKYDETMCEQLRPFTDILLAYDNDVPGESGAIKAANILGRGRCRRVYLPFNDINDCLKNDMNNMQLQPYFDQAKQYRDEQFFHISELFERMREYLKNKGQQSGVKTGWKKLDIMLGGVRPGEITTVTGDAGIGKSTFTTNLAFKLIDHGVCIVSTELLTVKVMNKLYSAHAKQTVGFNPPIEIVESCEEFLGSKNIFFLDVHGEVSIDRIKTNLETAHRYGCKIAILDHLHFFLPGKNEQSDRLEIEQFMRQLVMIARLTEMHIFLVVHPKYTDNNYVNSQGHPLPIRARDLKGSSAIMQDSHNIMSVWRNPTVLDSKTILFLLKVRDDAGITGEVDFMFNHATQRYAEI